MINLGENERRDVSQFICKYKFIDRKRIPGSKLSDLSRVFEDNVHLSLSFLSNNPLTVLETIIMALLILGALDREVAEILGIAPNTIRSYLSRIKYKLGVKTKSGAIVETLRNGIIKIIYTDQTRTS